MVHLKTIVRMFLKWGLLFAFKARSLENGCYKYLGNQGIRLGIYNAMSYLESNCIT